MPRSLADRIDRASLSRASVGKGSLGRFSVGTDISASSAATRHWVNSVSDIYGPDEIEELLQDLNKLELATFDTEEFQEFDIDGSQLGGLDILPTSVPTSPCARASSPGAISSRSWDSHTHYQQFKEPPDDYGWGGGGAPGHIIRPLQAAVCYCDISVLRTPRTLLRILVLLTSVACLSSLLTSGTAKLGVSALPHFPKLRLIIFVSIASALFSFLVVFLNISHLHALLPMDYAKMQTVIYLVVALGYLAASSLVLSVVVSYSDTQYSWLPSSTKHHLIATTVLGYICGLQTLVCSCQAARNSHYDKMEESSTNFTLHEAVASRAITSDSIMPRPHPPPAPRPIVRSQAERSGLTLANQNYHPPPPVHHHNYSDLVRHNLQHNHNGGRQLAPGNTYTPYRQKRSASPDTPPPRSASQHRLRSPDRELQDFYELRPHIPDLSPGRAQSPQLPYRLGRLDPPEHSKNELSARNDRRSNWVEKDTANKHLVHNQVSSKLSNKASVGNTTKQVNNQGDTVVNYSNTQTVGNKSDDINRTVHISSNSWNKKFGENLPRGDPSDSERTSASAILNNQKNEVELCGEPLIGERLRKSNSDHKEIHPAHHSFHSVPMKDTGAIPKKKKTAPLPSPLTVHPDEIISLPLDDLTPPTSASTQKHYYNYAH